ncbi:MAG: hypothetical protein HW376_1823 [candidate division NC10 bacterium]|nr:hypothetical protein [candidate division NC10 bacterium]
MADAAGAVQMLVDLHPTLREAVAPRGLGDLEPPPTERHAVVVPHDPLMVHGTDPIELAPGIGDERGPFVGWGHGPRPVVELDPGAGQEGIGRLDRPDACEAQLLGEPALPPRVRWICVGSMADWGRWGLRPVRVVMK